MLRTAKAVQLDTRSIQNYIFSSNRLKTNVGASYLVGKIYDEMEHIINEACQKKGLKMPVESWQQYDDIKMENDASIQCEVAYVGGGNMIILFDEQVEDEFCRSLVSQWTKKLLSYAPGLSTGCAFGKLVLGDDQQFEKSSKEMYRRLKINQDRIFPNVDLPYSGLTVECKLSGKAATCFAEVTFGNETKSYYVADSELAKINAASDANKDMQRVIKNELGITDGDWNFTDEIEKLGQKTGDEYVAVIHIDGNDMGVRFSDCKTLSERKYLSKQVAEYTKQTFAKLVGSILEEYAHYFDGSFVKDGMLEKQSLKNNILPIRPIIIGGDDITFVCPAKCGVIYAKRFMEFLQKIKLGNDFFHSCAGVAVVPTKYPFFRAYELAEELCSEAKKQARKLKGDSKQFKSGSSWLDFAIVHGEQSADLSIIRQEEYSGAQGNMHYGPYAVGTVDEYRNIMASKSIEKLIAGSLAMEKLPKNKVKEMRNVIAKDSGEIHLFTEQLRHNGVELPNVGDTMDRFKEELWAEVAGENVTPYLDMIEMMDFIYDDKGGRQ